MGALIASDSDSATWSAAVVVDTEDEVAAMVERAQSQEMIGRVRSIEDVLANPTPEQIVLRGNWPSARSVTDIFTRRRWVEPVGYPVGSRQIGSSGW